MAHTIKTAPARKGMRGDWEARSVVSIDGAEHVLKLLTSKAATGVGTLAQAVKMEPGGGFTFEMFGDFRETVLLDKGARGTGPNVDAQHQRALAMVPDVIERFHAFYAAKAAKTKAA